MELSTQEGEIPIPLNTSYGLGHHMVHQDHAHNHIIPTNGAGLGGAGPVEAHQTQKKRVIHYRECLKNHAASMGGNATDGCGEFMPSGEEGTLEALLCSACNCHRNFHRKEIEGESNSNNYDQFFHIPHLNRVSRKVILGHNPNLLGPKGIGYNPAQAHQMILPYNVGPLGSESDDGGGGGGGGPPQVVVKKRFRTKFTQEQKEKMLSFAEKVGWKMQRQEENVVQQFCQEIGIKRRVLKVWMHNNKHNLAKKSLSTTQDPI